MTVLALMPHHTIAAELEKERHAFMGYINNTLAKKTVVSDSASHSNSAKSNKQHSSQPQFFPLYPLFCPLGTSESDLSEKDALKVLKALKSRIEGTGTNKAVPLKSSDCYSLQSITFSKPTFQSCNDALYLQRQLNDSDIFSELLSDAGNTGSAESADVAIANAGSAESADAAIANAGISLSLKPWEQFLYDVSFPKFDFKTYAMIYGFIPNQTAGSDSRLSDSRLSNLDLDELYLKTKAIEMRVFRLVLLDIKKPASSQRNYSWAEIAGVWINCTAKKKGKI